MSDPSSPTPLHALAAFASEVRAAGLAPARQADVARRLMDVLGNALAATGLAEAAAVAQVVDGWGTSGPATAIGHPMPMAPSSAALLNGTLAHSLDYDDTHLPSILHPSASVVPAALAVAESTGADGDALGRAIAVGNEVCIRVGLAGFDPATGNSTFFDRGFHATSICGTIGGAVASAMLLGLDEDGLAHAMAIASSMGAGIIEANRTGGSVKRIHCGWAAHAGVVAAEMARAGLTGPPTVFEGRFGLLPSHCGEAHDIGAITADLGRRWELDRTFYKPYPCNHFTHPLVDGARQLRSRGVDASSIEAVDIGVATPTLRTIAEPAGVKARPPTAYAAQFSGPFVFATALLRGRGLGISLDDFGPADLADPALLDLAARVRLSGDDRCDAIYPHQFPAILRVTTRDGSVEEVDVLANRGGPENPLSEDELRRKFSDSAARHHPEVGPAVLDAIASLDRVSSLDQLTGPLRRPRSDRPSPSTA